MNLLFRRAVQTDAFFVLEFSIALSVQMTPMMLSPR